MTDRQYNWISTGPGGCDAHCIEHPCGKCILGENKKSLPKGAISNEEAERLKVTAPWFLSAYYRQED